MRLERSRRLVSSLAAGIVLSLGIVFPSDAAPTAPPTLTDERLTIPPQFGQVGCDKSGPFSFSVSGTATGPYNGTFTETGNATVNSTLQVVAFTATFTIHSTQGDVTGTKTMSGPPADFGCYHDAENAVVLDLSTMYQVTIHTSQGNYTDHGTSVIKVFKYQNRVVAFDETFASPQAQTTPMVPTSKDQCKQRGWQNYPQFKNQGNCVSFVEHQNK